MNVNNFLVYVKQDFKRTDKDTEIVQAYNDSINQVSFEMPHGAYKYQSYVPCVVKQEDYPLPSNIIHIIHPIRFIEGTGTNDFGYPLRHVDKAKYDEDFPNPNRTDPATTGKPSIYTIYSRSILVGPFPDSALYLLEINWTKIPVAQSASPGTDTPNLGAEWEEVLKEMTLSRVYRGIGLVGEASEYRSLYEDREGNPIGKYRRLLDIEEDREGENVGNMEVNNL